MGNKDIKKYKRAKKIIKQKQRRKKIVRFILNKILFLGFLKILFQKFYFYITFNLLLAFFSYKFGNTFSNQQFQDLTAKEAEIIRVTNEIKKLRLLVTEQTSRINTLNEQIKSSSEKQNEKIKSRIKSLKQAQMIS